MEEKFIPNDDSWESLVEEYPYPNIVDDMEWAEQPSDQAENEKERVVLEILA
jgi:hypothetical protein